MPPLLHLITQIKCSRHDARRRCRAPRPASRHTLTKLFSHPRVAGKPVDDGDPVRFREHKSRSSLSSLSLKMMEPCARSVEHGINCGTADLGWCREAPGSGNPFAFAGTRFDI